MTTQKINAFLMFNGKAEEAINFYTSVFDQSEINHMLHQEDGPVLHAIFTLKGQTFMAIDNGNGDVHPFTPAMSLFVTCDSEEELDQVFDAFAQNGKVLMPLAATVISEKFGWVEDQYGVSWQLNLAKSK